MPDAFEKKAPGSETLPAVPSVEKQAETEHAPAPERAPAAETSAAESTAPVAPTTPAAPAAPAAPIDPVMESIERIMSEDLMDFYRTMPPERQQEFKRKGEEVAGKIRSLMTRAAVKAKEVLTLIVGWLKLIPGVNKFFLEQESKIKTDKILELHKREHGNQ
jgi:hypothetical protein